MLGRLSVGQGRDQLETDVVGVGRRNGLGQFFTGHPINTHCLAAFVGAELLHPRSHRGTARTSVDANDGGLSTSAVATVTAITTDHSFAPTVITGRSQDEDRPDLEVPMPAQFRVTRRQTKHRPADDDVIGHRRTGHVLNHVRHTEFLKHRASRSQEVRMLFAIPHRPQRRKTLTRWTRMDRIKLVTVLANERNRVALDELERVSGLGFDIDADNVEPSTVVSDCGTTRTAVAVEQSGRAHAVTVSPLATPAGERVPVP